MRVQRLAVQMYTLRNAGLSVSEQFAHVAAAGYSGIETFGPLQPPAAELLPLLQSNGLRVVSAHVALETLRDELDSVIAFHQALGNDTLVVPWLHPEARPTTREGWSDFGRTLDALGARCRSEGMRLLYHNHDFEIATFDGRFALDWLFDAADPANLGAEVDVAWVVRGGADPVALLERLAGRCPRIHAKDVARPGQNPGEEGHADVGDGLIDWQALLAAARTAGVEWAVVEHDSPTDAVRSIERSAAYLSTRWP